MAVSAGGVAPAGSVIGIGTQRNIPRLPFFRRLIAETWAGKQMDGDLLRLLNGQPPCGGAPLDPKDHKAIGKSPIIASR